VRGVATRWSRVRLMQSRSWRQLRAAACVLGPPAIAQSSGPASCGPMWWPGRPSRIEPRNRDIDARKMQLVARDRPACYHYIQVACNSRPNGQQPNVAHSRTHSSKRLKRRRQHGLASNFSFQPAFFGLSPRRRRRERCPHATRPRSRSGRPVGARITGTNNQWLSAQGESPVV
jgi:hypothetical protein